MASRQQARLRRADCSKPGWSRRRAGRGFVYLDVAGRRIDDEEALARIRALAVPPAWEDVWLCPDPLGHLQATGVDAAGRKQYRYHARWRERRDQQKFDEMLEFAGALPRMRRQVRRDLRAGSELTRERVLACATRLLDLGFFRIGGEDYAEQNESFGLATMQRRHVTVRGDELVFDYEAKSGKRRLHAIADPDVRAVVQKLKRRRVAEPDLLAWRENGHWIDLRTHHVNDYVKEASGDEGVSAKDFRTWNATVLAAIAIATTGSDATSATARKRQVNAAVRHVANYLGNTPAVARSSYIDPRVFDRYLSGWTIGGLLDELGGHADLVRPRVRTRLEDAVIDLLENEKSSPSLEKLE
jgi:DNA topoisomerase-1